jgi:hypothetical protein
MVERMKPIYLKKNMYKKQNEKFKTDFFFKSVKKSVFQKKKSLKTSEFVQKFITHTRKTQII